MRIRKSTSKTNILQLKLTFAKLNFNLQRRWPSPRKTKAEKWSTTLKSLLNDNIDCTKSWVGPPTSFPRSENWPQFQLITSKSHQVLNGFSYLDDPIGNDLLDIYIFLSSRQERERDLFLITVTHKDCG